MSLKYNLMIIICFWDYLLVKLLIYELYIFLHVDVFRATTYTYN